MDPSEAVQRHYGGGGLEAAVVAALESVGVDIHALQAEQLAGIDQLHAGFAAATAYLLNRLDLAPETTLLDVGCGVGGPARWAAARHRSRVTGIDLSADFIQLARALTQRVRLEELVNFDVGSATELPYPDGSFDRAMLNHVGMNIADKHRLVLEVRRVLKPGGLFALYEQMRIGEGELPFPLPWAADETTSFVETRTRYVELLEENRFRVEHEEDRTAANAAGGPPPSGALGPGVLFGPAFAERLANNLAAASSGTLGAVLLVARAV